jgi:UPF0176 protein
MAVLHNRVSQDELKRLLYEETEPRITISFYRYFSIPDPVLFRNELYTSLNKLNVFGRIYVAHEGINAQLSVPESKFDGLRETLEAVESLKALRLNVAVDDDGKSFWVLKVKVRDKIVADGIDDPGFSMSQKGKYVNAAQMNELLKEAGTVVIDMRNHYEYEVGHFSSALPVPSDTFREQLPMAVEMMKDQKDRNIVMYCTGGIRCEKASAYMLHHGFRNAFHLEGGIINYAREVKEAGLESRFIGKNFVFDDRLGERITEDVIAQCHQCGKPADTHTNCRNSACHLLFIQCDACSEKFQGCCSPACVDQINLPADEQKKLRQGIDKGRMVFNKSRQRLESTMHKSAEDSR